jgi:hypothetical protein
MRRGGAPLVAAAALAGSSLLLHCAQARAAPANTIDELSAKIGDCLRPVRAPPTSSFTVLFSLKRDGGLFGAPRITYSDLKGDPGDQKRFVEDALAAINDCLPIEITDGLGGAIAGRPIVVRIGPARRATDL